MKKLFALFLIAILAMSTVAAFAATYNYDNDLIFNYDENNFEISMDDHTDDEDLIILTAKDASWGEETYIRIHLRDLDDGEQFPTMDEFTAMPGASEVTQGEWNGYSNVFMYTVENEDGSQDNFFIAPVMDDDGDEVEDILTVEICVSKIEDEDIAMGRDDQISAVVDSLKIDD